MTTISTHIAELMDNSRGYSFDELCDLSEVDKSVVLELAEYDIIQPDSAQESYSYHQFAMLKKAVRLQRDLELNTAAVALVFELLERISEQKRELKLLRYQQQIPAQEDQDQSV